METVNTVVNAASKAIWGEQDASKATNETGGSEPVSGLQGKGTATEPYDQGNAAIGEQDAVATTLGNETGGKEPLSGVQGKGTPSEPFDQGNYQDNPAHAADSTRQSNISDPILVSKSETGTHEPTTFEPFKSDATETDTRTPSTSQIPVLPSEPVTIGESKPLEKKEPAGLASPAQNYTLSDGELVPAGDSSKSGALGGVSDTHAITSKKDHGDELRKTRDHADFSSESNKPGSHDLGKESQGVKATGLHSEGGDLNATKPGTGKEADRIVEEKGDHRDVSAKVDSTPAAPASGEKEKVSKLGKIKDKLHIGHKDK